MKYIELMTISEFTRRWKAIENPESMDTKEIADELGLPVSSAMFKLHQLGFLKELKQKREQNEQSN